MQGVDRICGKTGPVRNDNFDEISRVVNDMDLLSAVERTDEGVRVVLASASVLKEFFSACCISPPVLEKHREKIHNKMKAAKSPAQIQKIIKDNFLSTFGDVTYDTQYGVGGYLLSVLQFKDKRIVGENGENPNFVAAAMLHARQTAEEHGFLFATIFSRLSQMLGVTSRVPVRLITDDDQSIKRAIDDAALFRGTEHLNCYIHLRESLRRRCQKDGVEFTFWCDVIFGDPHQTLDGVVNSTTTTMIRDVLKRTCKSKNVPRTFKKWWVFKFICNMILLPSICYRSLILFFSGC